MKLEDYSKYYIQGSDHYLVPKDIFVELFNEMINWKQENKELKSQLKGTTHCYDEAEHRQLKKQLEHCYCNRTDCSGRIKDSKQYDSLVQKVENQQQEFIKYLEDEINKTDYEVNILGNYPYLAWSNACKKNLQKYKEIIGVSDEKDNN